MYRETRASSCPACSEALVAVPSALPAQGCTACGGMWLGPEATVHVMRGLDDDVVRSLLESSAVVEERAHVPPRPRPSSYVEAGRACPVCHAALSPVDVAGTRIDSCPTHGAFFDEHEVTHIVSACTSLTREQRGELTLKDVVAAFLALFPGAE